MRLASLAMLLAVPASSLTASGACSTPVAECTERLNLEGGKHVLIFRTFPLAKGSDAPAAAVIMIHGGARDADRYFGVAVNAAQGAGAADHTLAIAPYFRSNAGGRCTDLIAEGELAFPCEGWKDGQLAVDTPPDTLLTSFDVIDKIIYTLNDRTLFPNLRSIVVAGHSAGGQFVQRYAGAGRAEEHSRLPIRYVVANPSSYMYLNALRLPAGHTCTEAGVCDAKFATRPANAECPTFNQFNYGMEKTRGYVSKPLEAEIRKQYVARSVTYLVGELDVKADVSTDKSCEEMVQGKNRRERGTVFWSYIRSQFKARHGFAVVPGCGHSAGCMFESEIGRKTLFP